MVSNAAMKTVGAAVLGLAALWLFGPLLTCVHVEGFTASIGSIALHLTHDRLANYDRLFPFNLQFFAFSRLGTNLFVALLVGPFGLPAEWALRLTMWGGFICLAGGSYVLVRRWTEAPPLAVTLMLVLTPGLAETGFFYNDNMLSAGLATLALALLVVSARPVATVAAGLLFGYAVLARTDALLLAPAVALVLWRREGVSWRLVGHCAVFGVMAAGLASAILAVFGLTPLTVLRIAAHAVTLWARPTHWQVQAISILWFVGPLTLGLAAVGLVMLALGRRGYLLLLIAGVPLLYNVVYFGKVWEARQLAPLTPFIVSAAVFGLQPFLDARTRGSRVPLILLAAFAALVTLTPPAFIVREGPHAMLGRLWTPMAWYRWQAATRASIDGVDRFVDRPGARLSVVVTDIWDADRYVHLQLQEQGYRPFDLPGVYPACSPVAEGFERGGVRIVHLRLHTPFLSDWRLRLAPRFAGSGRACLAQVGATDVVMVSTLSRIDSLFSGAGPDSPWIAQARRLAPGGVDPLTGRLLTPALQATLPDAFRRDADLWRRLDPDGAAPVHGDLSAIR